MTSPAYKDVLFAPIRINKTTVRNRFVFPPMQRGSSWDYSPSYEMAEAFGAWAAGGSGIIICEGCSPDLPEAYWQPIFTAIREEDKEIWRAIAQNVRKAGAIFLNQLWHVGSVRRLVPGLYNPYPDQETLSPSGLVQDDRPNGRAMTKEEIDRLKAGYVTAALLSKEVGAHGVEVHCAHGYLLDQFLWHETNLRTDEYGGATLADRARFPAEVVRAIREAAGPDFIISVRFSQWKEVDYGARIAETPEDLSGFIRVMEAAGTDMFHVSTRRFNKPAWPELDPRRSLASWVKTMTTRPVVAVGSVGLTTDLAADVFDNRDPELRVEEDMHKVAEGIVNGDFDLIAVGRAQIANVDFVERVRNGQIANLRPFRKHELLKMDGEKTYVHHGQIVDEYHKRGDDD
jgi:2,4-dienoyl-CoA reductase-like NADH-dependent reductase (Old Yellow Enzyme family)